MSSRALRKIQREREEQKRVQNGSHSDNDIDSEDELPAGPPPAKNAFDMLQDETEGDQDAASEDQASNGEPFAEPSRSLALQPSKKKKHKKKGKTKAQEVPGLKKTPALETQPIGNDGKGMDEIDLALKSLSTKSNQESLTSAENTGIDEANEVLCRLLAVESKHLNALNEMKRLFGNVILEGEDDAAATPRRRGRGPQQLDLGGALNARNSPVARGQGLAGLALRRNFFIQGKEEWPKGTGGGLGMELVEKFDDSTVEYRFVHNTIYQDVQRQFEVCVESLDPQRMIQMLVYNPYHVSTLLQVSEIAKQQGDHSVSGDLLERALFTFGRSVHSSFTNAVSQGKARLDFRRPENREFWLAAWRYMNNLGQRGTWRTAYEWAKLILSLDPEGDPYCISKVIDQYALRGGQPDHFIQLVRATSNYLSTVWDDRPNILMSLSLAEYRLKRNVECRQTLTDNVILFPWLFPPLLSALDISPAPPSVWGKSPRTEAEKYETEHYVQCAKDLWNTPETTSLLMEVVSTLPSSIMRTPDIKPRLITLDEAREAFLLGIPAIINTIPRAFTAQAASNSDPFPPIENVVSYDPSPSGGTYTERYEPDEDHIAAVTQTRTEAEQQEMQGLRGFFSRFLPWLDPSTNTSSPNAPDEDAMNEMTARAVQNMDEAGISQDEVGTRGNRLLELLSAAGNRESASEEQPPGSEPVSDRRWLHDLLWGGRWPAQENVGGSDGVGEDAALNRNAGPLTGAADDNNNTASRQAPVHHGASQEAEQEASSAATPADSEPEAYDDAKNQRWLAGQGMLRLKEFTAIHGTNLETWPSGSTGFHLLAEYTSRLRLLEREKSRRWILDSALRQGAGKDVSEMVEQNLNR